MTAARLHLVVQPSGTTVVKCGFCAGGEDHPDGPATISGSFTTEAEQALSAVTS